MDAYGEERSEALRWSMWIEEIKNRGGNVGKNGDIVDFLSVRRSQSKKAQRRGRIRTKVTDLVHRCMRRYQNAPP